MMNLPFVGGAGWPFCFLFNSVVGRTKNISILYVEYGINAFVDVEWIILELLNLL